MNRNSKKKGKKLLALLLALTVLLSGNWMTAYAEADSGDAERKNPVNPVHNCASGKYDTATWSYVYFGSYPQSEVMDEEEKDVIDAAIAVSGNAVSGNDVGTDILVNGIKYRRISENDTSDNEFFDDVPNNSYRYFKWEPIRWKVLENDGETLFVVADKAVDCKNYNEEDASVTWEDSTIREWLNNSFYGTAFNEEEQNAVVTQNVVNEGNPEYDTQGGNDTRDNVYLLSISEVTNEAYGFCSDSYTHSMSRGMEASDYANASGAWIDHDSDYERSCWWWLRSPGADSSNAAAVSDERYVDWGGRYVSGGGGGVCPALHINLSSDISFVEEEGNSEGVDNLAKPIHHCIKDKVDNTEFSYIYFGSYPQSEVTDITTIKAIDNAITTAGTTADAGMDVWVNETKYRRISKGDTSYSPFFDDVSNNDYRYFKWEPIKWKVLQNDGETLFVASDKALDCMSFEEEGARGIWENSVIREWLNNSFYGTAFSEEEQNAIVTQNVVNEDNPEYGTEGGNDTRDNVYLLSISEATNEAYGFCSDSDAYSASRWVQPSNYAHIRGTYIENDSNTGGKDNCGWWLRSPGCISYTAADVYSSGYVDCSSLSAPLNSGICPALHINLSSDLWFTADDGTSGEGGDREEKILQAIRVSKAKTEYEQGEPLNLNDLTVTAVYEDSKTALLPAGSYTTNAASIDMNIPGSKTLTISYTEGSITKTAAIAITVKAKVSENTPQPVKVKKLTLSAPSKNLAAGKKVKLTLEVEPANATDKTVTWKSSNTKYATVDQKGTVTLKPAGAGKTVTITATANDGSGKKATLKLTIKKDAVKSIKLKAPQKTLKTGKSMTVKAIVKTTGSKANKTLKWTSSNTKYATVNSKGKVTAKKAGKGKNVTITAASTDGSNKKATVKIKIK